MSLLNKVERKIGRIAIPNLMFLIVVGMFSVFIINMLLPQLRLSSWLYLDRDLVFQGQVWRLITFIFYPPSSSPIFIIFSLYFYYMIGNALENQWGTARFNIYYFVGVIGTIISAMITGYAENTYLNFSLFFAFAALFPNYEVLMFFILPIKIKFLALVDALFFLVSFVGGSWSTKAAIVFSLVNFFLFFGRDFFDHLKNGGQYRKNQQNYRQYMNKNRWR